ELGRTAQRAGERRIVAVLIVRVVTRFELKAKAARPLVAERTGDEHSVALAQIRVCRKRRSGDGMDRIHVVITDAEAEIPPLGIIGRCWDYAKRRQCHARQGDRTKFHFYPRFKYRRAGTPPPKRSDDIEVITATPDDVSPDRFGIRPFLGPTTAFALAL